MEQVLTVSCKLQVPPVAGVALELDATLKAFADACNFLNGELAPQITSRLRIQVMLYQQVRGQFMLSANQAIRAIARVSASRKTAKAKGAAVREFRPTSADYDARIFRFREQDWTVSLRLMGRTRRFNLSIGNYQRGLLKGQKPTSATLVKRRNGDYYLQIQVKSAPPVPTKASKVVGIDLGRRDIAHTSEGQSFSGDGLNAIRDKFARVRASAQQRAAKGTRSSRRRCRQLLQRLSGRERRFQGQVNHTISYRLVRDASAGGYSLAVEDLTGIRERVKVKGPEQRRKAHSWAFYQLRQFLTYKAIRSGVVLVPVNPAYTSKTCHQCLHIGTRVGKDFHCDNCGWRGDADFNGACNIAALGRLVDSPGGPGLYCALQDSLRAPESSLHIA